MFADDINDAIMFLMRQSRAFTSRAHGHNAVSTGFDMKVDQLVKLLFIRLPVSMEWSDESDGESVIDFTFSSHFAAFQGSKDESGATCHQSTKVTVWRGD